MMDFSAWKEQVFALIPGSMIYEIDLRPLFKRGMVPAGAVEVCREANKIVRRDSDMAPQPVRYFGGRPLKRGVRLKRLPLWSLAYIQAKIKAAAYAILVEAETHRLEADAVDYVRKMKRHLLES